MRVSGSLIAVPTLAEVIQAPALVEALPPDVLARYYTTVAGLEALMRAKLMAPSMTTAAMALPAMPEPEERWLSPDEAAAAFGVSKRWLLSRQEQIPGRRRLSRKVIRFDARLLAKYLRRDSA
jgi:hypothetical protein